MGFQDVKNVAIKRPLHKSGSLERDSACVAAVIDATHRLCAGHTALEYGVPVQTQDASDICPESTKKVLESMPPSIGPPLFARICLRKHPDDPHYDRATHYAQIGGGVVWSEMMPSVGGEIHQREYVLEVWPIVGASLRALPEYLICKSLNIGDLASTRTVSYRTSKAEQFSSKVTRERKAGVIREAGANNQKISWIECQTTSPRTLGANSIALSPANAILGYRQNSCTRSADDNKPVPW